MIVDTHTHVTPYWFEPIEPLLFQMDRHGVDRALLVQNYHEPDNEYLFECVRRFPGRFAPVVWVDWTAPDAPERLARLAERGAAGVRLFLGARSPGEDPLAIWRVAESLDLTVHCPALGAEWGDEGTEALIRAVPRLRIVGEHLFGTSRPAEVEKRLPLLLDLFPRLGSFPNVFVKIHGLGEFCLPAGSPIQPFPFRRPIPPLLDLAYECFGPSRMMWGSNWPLVSAQEGYGNALKHTLDQFGGRTEEERALIFGGTALRLHRFA